MRYRYQSGGQVNEVILERQGEQYTARIGDQVCPFRVLDIQPGELNLLIEGRPVRLYWAIDGHNKWISLDGCTYLLERPAPQSARRATEKPGEAAVRAPMPSRVRSIEVQPGDQVQKGQTLLLLEAMKMEIRIQAPASGQVSKVLAEVGQTVNRDQTLIELSFAEN